VAHDAFISYSSEDKLAADAACAALERTGIRCWIAPRDITPGAEWGAAIIDAIEHCAVLVLIFSSNANESRQIRREVEHAVSKGVTIVPMRIDQAEPIRSLAYFMAGVHWLDALTPPLENHLQGLAASIKAFLQAAPTNLPSEPGQTQPSHAPTSIFSEGPAVTTPGRASQKGYDELDKKERPQGHRTSFLRPATVISTVAAVLLVVVVAWVLVPRQVTSPPMATPVAPSAAPKISAAEALQRGEEAARLKDYAEALRWYRQAADQGDVVAQVKIGFLYHNGLGVAQDYGEALRWYRKAADQGNAVAQHNLALQYYNGWGVAQDRDQAQAWMKKAAAGGNENAKQWLASH
jgi:tetratricopeptide (TPR) repeat protein